jgi:hypothetical protein
MDLLKPWDQWAVESVGCSGAARNNDGVRPRHIVIRPQCGQRKCGAIRRNVTSAFGHEADLRVGQEPEALVRADGVQGGQARVQHYLDQARSH